MISAEANPELWATSAADSNRSSFLASADLHPLGIWPGAMILAKSLPLEISSMLNQVIRTPLGNARRSPSGSCIASLANPPLKHPAPVFQPRFLALGYLFLGMWLVPSPSSSPRGTVGFPHIPPTSGSKVVSKDGNWKGKRPLSRSSEMTAREELGSKQH